MKILCFIDSLGCGGAQRQLTTLAVGLKKRGHQVRCLVYYPYDHFLPLLQAEDIPCQVIPHCSHWQRALAVRRILRQDWQNVVLAFLEGPCLYAELATIPSRQWGLVAGERSGSPRIKMLTGRMKRQFHRFADAVVCNSHSNRLMLETQLPFLKQKLTTVYNIVDLELFHPQPIEIITADNSKAIRVVVAARYEENKNMVGVARAMLRIKEYSLVPAIKIDWYGCESGDPAPYNRAARIIVENGLSNDIQLHPPTERIANEFASADAVGLFSFYEGLPNAVSEGMACGKPILLSNVCDAGNLVQDGKNGFLCEPNSPESIADSLMRFAAMNKQKQLQMGLESRRMAETLFAENVVIERYERILQAAASHQAVPSDCNWPMHVPESAIKMVESKTVHRTKINYSEESD